MLFLTWVVVRVRNQKKFQRLLVPLVTMVTDLKTLFPGAAIRIVKREEVVNVQQLKHRQT